MQRHIRQLIPRPLLRAYHYAFAAGAALWYGQPSKKLFVIGVTGTKGKSTVSELVYRILSEAGYTVALASTIHFVIGQEVEPNLFKMTMPGRGYLQKFLRRALNAGASHVVVEMTSEGALQHRHVGVELDALVFTNLQREHIERHGSMEAYAAAKLSLATHLAHSAKRPRYIVANADDRYGADFLATPVEYQLPFCLADAEPYTADDRGVRFVWKRGSLFTAPLPGLFNLRNILAALTLCDALGIAHSTIERALAHMPAVAGRAERVDAGQPFSVIVDYAHTPDSLEALLSTYQGKRLICLMGSTGGGRDQWKRPQMGSIADERCALAILTNEDPYDEDPEQIVSSIAKGFNKQKPQVVLDRRAAIATALREAREGDVVLLTGKGTDPYIMGPRGQKTPWSDARVAREELQKLGYH